jgi:CheY-like chemotaxis protein
MKSSADRPFRRAVGRSTARSLRRQRMHPVRSVAASLLACVLLGTAAPAQEPAAKKPVDLYASARTLIESGKFDLAVEQLKAFRDANPTDADFLEVERKFGGDTFLRLKRVYKWDDNPTADAEAKKLVDDLILKSVEASRRLFQDPERITKYVRNLGRSTAEREFAVDQLKLAGEAAAAVLVAEYRGTSDTDLKSGILTAVPRLPATTVPPLLAALDGLADDARAAFLQAIARRPDVPRLVDQADTDFTPHLWYYSTSKTPTLRAAATGLLVALRGEAGARTPADVELVRSADPFTRHTAKFATLDPASNKVRVWVWDAAKNTVKADPVSVSDAEEYFALRRLKWAVEVNPESDAAQAAFVATVAERAVTRVRFGELAKAEPAAAILLSSAPPALLTQLLETGLRERRTALLVGVLRAMAYRSQPDTPGRPSLYSRALSYDDFRVQFAAATAILRSPGGESADSRPRIVDVLKRAVAADADGGAAGQVGRAIIADPDAARGERLAATFRTLGYAAERFATGKDLIRRVSRSSDFDLIVIDHHIVNPLLADLLPQLAADPNTAKRPTVIVATSDKRAQKVSVESLLLRLAMLIAATDDNTAVVPPPYAFNPRLPDADRAKAREENVNERDANIEAIAKLRLQRLQRLVEAADLPTDRNLASRMEVRLPQLTYALIAREHAVTADSAPVAARRLADYSALLRTARKGDDPFARVVDTDGLNRVIDQLEESLTADGRKRYEEFQRRVLPEQLGIDIGNWRDELLELSLAKMAKRYAGVSVIPESFTPAGLAVELQAATPTDPAQAARSAEEKAFTAKVAAGWLRKIATGEIDGYDARPAEAAMRAGLRVDDLAVDLSEGLAYLGSGDTQLALVMVATDTTRPQPVRFAAADAAIRHARRFGRLTQESSVAKLAEVAAAEQDRELKTRLIGLLVAVAPKASDFSKAIGVFPVKPSYAQPPAADAPKDPAAPPKAPDADKQPKGSDK